MTEFRDHLASLGVRLLFAGPLFILSVWLYVKASDSGQLGLGVGFLACGALIAGGIILAFPLAGMLSEFSGSLFYSGEKFAKAPPMYSIPQSKVKKGLYDEAMQLYVEMAAKYPEEIRPHIEMMNIAMIHLHDPERAKRIYEQAMTLFAKPDERDTLTRMYAAFQSCINATPDWQKRHRIPLNPKPLEKWFAQHR